MSKKIKLLQILFFTLFAIPSHSKAIFTPEMREELCARKRQHISAPPITLLPEGSVDWFHDIGDFASRGRFAFNNAPELLGSIACLVRNHHIDMIIETGTFKGHTTLGLALLAPTHTIDINQSYYRKSAALLEGKPNITRHIGHSATVLASILPDLIDKRILFYLDAHWLSDWPLLAEIEAVATTHKDRCVLVIDDAQVPHYHSIPFDSYDGKNLSYDYVKPVLGQAFSQHKVSYLIPKKPQSRAKMVIEPVSTNTPST